MKKAVYVLFADTFETIEALTVVDVIRRSPVPLVMVSMNDTLDVTSGQNITVKCDILFKDIVPATEMAALYLPGGLPAARVLSENPAVQKLVREVHELAIPMAAICAGPLSFASSGIASKITGCSHPSVKDEVAFASYSDSITAQDGNIFTGRGAAASIYLAFDLLSQLCPADKVAQIRQGMEQDFIDKLFA